MFTVRVLNGFAAKAHCVGFFLRIRVPQVLYNSGFEATEAARAPSILYDI